MKKTLVFSREYDGLIKAFCKAEAAQFEYRSSTGEDEFSKRLFNQIVEYEREDPAFNYAIFQSISKMGTITHEMKVSTSHYKFGRNLHVTFPLSPRSGQVNFRVEEL